MVDTLLDPEADIPLDLEVDIPLDPEAATEVSGAHPTGMYSCLSMPSTFPYLDFVW